MPLEDFGIAFGATVLFFLRSMGSHAYHALIGIVFVILFL